jgi:putative ABC transport system ATP-binding protein
VLPALEITDTAKRRGTGTSGEFALLIPHFAVAPGEAIAITGPSGSGKSTLLDMLALALKPDTAKRFSIAEVDAALLWQRDRADALARLRAGTLGYVLQQGGLLPFLSVRQNILLPQRLAGRIDPARLAALADRLGITDQLDKKPAALSVGQRQRAAIARALAHRPGIVLADEPTASVHPEMADTILALLVDTARESGAALVLATHDPTRAEAAGFTLLPLATGREDDTAISVLERQ